MSLPLKGLYAITDGKEGDLLLAQAQIALSNGVRILQYRDKSQDHLRRLTEAKALAHLCRAHDALFIVNDDVQLAAAVAANGVHLGRDDPDLAQARQNLGPSAIIGVSCYNQLDRAQVAVEQGADYLAFGRFFPSRTKPEAVLADPGLLHQAKRKWRLPLVAIGGITPENGGLLTQAGADMLAVIQGVFGQADIAEACRRFQRLF
jgi:thiamine-phosphate pyrophosphorylase